MRRQTKESVLYRKEQDAWRRWNEDQRPPRISPEQCLEWLDGWRALMFEVWQQNPDLRKRYEQWNAVPT